jgi:hypothetical protein
MRGKNFILPFLFLYQSVFGLINSGNKKSLNDVKLFYQKKGIKKMYKIWEGREYETLAEVEKRVPYFIQEVYNRKRLHSSLRYRPPEQFERMILKNNNLTPVCPL